MQVGTSVVTRNQDQRLAIGRLGALVESLETIVRSGRQVILVTSGATAVGRQKLRFQQVLNSSPLEMQMLGLSSLQARAAAAAGQSGLMALYDSLFQMMDMQCSQFLVTSRDFKNEDFKKNLIMTVDNLLQMNVVPVINENDSISSSVRPFQFHVPRAVRHEAAPALISPSQQCDRVKQWPWS
jgi:delta-1-pyrroline-5-carboxylate synthetase